VADRSRPTSEIERHELVGQQRLQHIEHDPESLFALRHVPRLLRIPPLEPVFPIEVIRFVRVSRFVGRHESALIVT
jgi:hypothetical protein